MAVFTIGLQSNVISGSKDYNLSDGDVTRWINALKVTVPDGASKSNGALLLWWADDVMATLKRQVLYVEAQQAAANVAPIVVA